jgi:hypothetical protein
MCSSSSEFVHRNWVRWVGLEGGRGSVRPTVGGGWRRAVRQGIAKARPAADGDRRRSAGVGGRGHDDKDD